MRKLFILKNELKDLYLKQKLTTYQIAEKFGSCQTTIWKRLHEYNIKARFPWNTVDLSKQKLKQLYIGQKLSTWQIEKDYDYCRSTIHKKLREFNIPTRNLASSHFLFSRSNFSGNLPEKAYLIGFSMGDLNVTKRGYQSETIMVKCGTTQKSQIVLFRKLFSRYGRIWEGKITKSGRINIQASLNPTFLFLLKKRKLADDWIINNKNYFFAFLAGFSDAEGSFYVTNNQGTFAIGNYNLKLLKQIKSTLYKHGILTPRIGIHYCKGIRNIHGYLWNNNYHTLHCSKKIYLLELIRQLKPFIKHPKKVKDMKKVYKNIKNRNQLYGNINIT